MKRYMIFAAVAVLAACSPRQMQDVATEGSELGYSIKMLKTALNASGKDKNVTVSPYSAGVALSMLTEGAVGETKAELDNALNACLFRHTDLGNNDTVVVTSANSVWLDDDFAVRNTYVSHLAKEYDAFADVLRFSDPASVKAINNWCSEHTDGMIDGIVSRLTPEMKMLLVNALYFKAAWETPFDKRYTKDGVFHGTEGDSEASFMYRKGNFAYAEYDGNQLICLPYKGGRYSMYVLLPSEELGVDGALPYLTEAGVKEAVNRLENTRVQLLLPKFKQETTLSLIETLEAMGVRTVFTSSADLSGIANGPLSVSDVLQKTVVEVDEKGTEAAAVTAVVVGLTSAMPQQVIQMNVNRPFLFMIADMQAGRVLFAGKMMNLQPSSSL